MNYNVLQIIAIHYHCEVIITDIENCNLIIKVNK